MIIIRRESGPQPRPEVNKMPIFFRAGGPSNCPQFGHAPLTRRLAGNFERGTIKPADIASAATTISTMAGGKLGERIEPGAGGGTGNFEFAGGKLMYEGKPFLICRDIDSANVAGHVFPIVLISASFELNEAWGAPFTGNRGSEKTSGFSSAEQFEAYAEKIGGLVEVHLNRELSRIAALSGCEVKVAVGLDMTDKPVLMVDLLPAAA